MELQARYDVIRMSADLQEALTALLLSGARCSEIAEHGIPASRAAGHHSRPPSRSRRVRSRGFRIRRAYSGDQGPDLEGRRRFPRISFESGGPASSIVRASSPAREHFGWAMVFGPETPSGVVQLALGEICATIALHRMKETRRGQGSFRQAGFASLGHDRSARRRASRRVRAGAGSRRRSQRRYVRDRSARSKQPSPRRGGRIRSGQLAAGGRRASNAPASVQPDGQALHVARRRTDRRRRRQGWKGAVATSPKRYARTWTRDAGRNHADGRKPPHRCSGRHSVACKDARIALAVTRHAGRNRRARR